MPWYRDYGRRNDLTHQGLSLANKSVVPTHCLDLCGGLCTLSIHRSVELWTTEAMLLPQASYHVQQTEVTVKLLVRHRDAKIDGDTFQKTQDRNRTTPANIDTL